MADDIRPPVFGPVWDGIYGPSQALGGDVLAERLRFTPLDEPALVPPIPRHAVCLQRSAAAFEIRHRVGGAPWQRAEAAPDRINVLPAQQDYAWLWRTEHEVCYLLLDPALLLKAAAEAGDVEPSTVELIPRLEVEDPALGQLIRALGEAEAAAPAGTLYVDAVAQALAVHLLQYHTAFGGGVRSYRGGLAPPRLRRVEEYVRARLDERVRLEDLAAVAEMNAYHFLRLFKASTGQTPYQYVIARRMERARQLLRETELPISQVALEVGYRSQSAFTAAFTRVVGVPPGVYRRGSGAL